MSSDDMIILKIKKNFRPKILTLSLFQWLTLATSGLAILQKSAPNWLVTHTSTDLEIHLISVYKPGC